MKKTKILVVVDCQNDFITGSLGNKDAVDVVPNIANRIDEFDGDYIFATMDTHDDDYLETKEGKSLPVAHCIDGTDGFEIESSVSDALTRASKKGIHVEVVWKPTFGSVVLVERIENIDGEFDIEICGFCTDICVVSNALMLKAALFDRADISVNPALCAGTTPENHKAALKVMKSCQISII